MRSRCSTKISDIVRLFGSQLKLAVTIDRRQSTIAAWIKHNRVPSKRIPQIIAAAARLNPPVHLRPDDFFDLPAPVPQATAAEEARA